MLFVKTGGWRKSWALEKVVHAKAQSRNLPRIQDLRAATYRTKQ